MLSSPKDKINGDNIFATVVDSESVVECAHKDFQFLPHTHEEIKKYLCKLLHNVIPGGLFLLTVFAYCTKNWLSQATNTDFQFMKDLHNSHVSLAWTLYIADN